MKPPFRAASADQAAEWLTTLMASDCAAAERQRWQQWRAADADHERAWQHLEAVCARLRGLPGGAAYQALTAVQPSARRRQFIAVMLGTGMTGAFGIAASRSQQWRQLSADLRTSVGERREWTLDDGSRVLLNTDSAVNLQFDGHQRLLTLVAGEIRIQTGHASRDVGAGRPFIVQTAQGRVRALGTAFTLRQRAGRTEVAVQQSAVEITPSSAAQTSLRLAAGQRAWFSTRDVAAPTPASADDNAWTLGALVADNMRLDDFLAELGRYRHGVLRCDPAVAGMRFSGVFPLKDTGAVLAMLPNSLPVRVRGFSPYWVSVEKK
jgi:transmembrane sensor